MFTLEPRRAAWFWCVDGRSSLAVLAPCCSGAVVLLCCGSAVC